MSQETQLAVWNPDRMSTVEKAGHFLAKSGMFGTDRPEQGLVLALEMAMTGKSPTQILRRNDIIGGKMKLKSAAALADFRAAGGRHRWINIGDKPTGPKPEDHYAEAWLKAKDGEELTVRYSMADAARACLVRKDSQWIKDPGVMLRARVASRGIAMLCPEVYTGDDEESDSPAQATEAAGLDLGKAAPVTKVEVSAPIAPEEAATAPKTEPKVIDVQAVPVESKTAPKADESELAAAGLSPEQPTTHPLSEPGLLDAETLAKLEAAIGDIAPQALKWLRLQKWIGPDQGFEHLPKGGTGDSKIDGRSVARITTFLAGFRTAVLGMFPATP